MQQTKPDLETLIAAGLLSRIFARATGKSAADVFEKALQKKLSKSIRTSAVTQGKNKFKSEMANARLPGFAPGERTITRRFLKPNSVVTTLDDKALNQRTITQTFRSGKTVETRLELPSAANPDPRIFYRAMLDPKRRVYSFQAPGIPELANLKPGGVRLIRLDPKNPSSAVRFERVEPIEPSSIFSGDPFVHAPSKTFGKGGFLPGPLGGIGALGFGGYYGYSEAVDKNSAEAPQ